MAEADKTAMNFAQTHAEGATQLPREQEQIAEERHHHKEEHHLHPEQHGNSHNASEPEKHHDGVSEKRRSISDVLHLPQHHHRHLAGEGDETHKKEKRASISENGPFYVVKDPETGMYITRPNPHWPEEDSWKRKNVRSGQGDDKVVAPGGLGGASFY